MAVYLLSILGLGLLCAAWVGLELWLRRLDPEGGARRERCGGCGGCATGQEPSSGQHVSDTCDGVAKRGA